MRLTRLTTRTRLTTADKAGNIDDEADDADEAGDLDHEADDEASDLDDSFDDEAGEADEVDGQTRAMTQRLPPAAQSGGRLDRRRRPRQATAGRMSCGAAIQRGTGTCRLAQEVVRAVAVGGGAGVLEWVRV